VGVVREADGSLHFYVNSRDQGLAARDVPANIYGVIDLYGQAARATIINTTGNVFVYHVCQVNVGNGRDNSTAGHSSCRAQGPQSVGGTLLWLAQPLGTASRRPADFITVQRYICKKTRNSFIWL